MKYIRYKRGCEISHSRYVNILLPIQCKRGCGIYSTVFASHRLRELKNRIFLINSPLKEGVLGETLVSLMRRRSA